MWELTDLRKNASVLKESNGKFVVSSSVGNTKCSNIYLSDVINIPYVSQTYVKVKDTE